MRMLMGVIMVMVVRVFGFAAAIARWFFTGHSASAFRAHLLDLQ
jgi:hypothetical protein